MLDFEEKALCRKAAGILELSVKKGYDHYSFSRLWLKSKTANNLSLLSAKFFSKILPSPVLQLAI